jgi:type I restriction enzyme S subunit
MMELNISKDKWVKVKLLDVFIKKEENDKENARNRFDRFLKVEHMDAESLRIKRWASQEKGDELNPYFYKIFRKGQLLFPTRNPHLRRTVLASFDGICGEKTLTLEPIEHLVIPEFIPFLFHSESFYAHTAGAIIGSTNPHVRWRDVANYEFLLPPKDQQAQLAELLWAMDEVIEREREVLERLIVNKKSFEARNLLKFYSGIQDNLPNGYQVMRLGEIAEISGGSTPSRDVEKYWNGDIPWLTPTDVTNHNRINLSHTKEKITEIGLKSISNRLYPPGSILYCSRATIGFAIINDVPMSTNQGFSNFIVNEKVSNYFLYFLLQHITPELTKLAGGSTFLEISKSAIRNFKVIVPSLDIQGYIELKLLEFENNRITIESKRIASKALQKSLINQIF